MVLLLVLGTAVLHASWNAVAKSIGDRFVASLLIGAASGLAGLIGVLATTPMIGLPAPASWPFLLGSAGFQCLYLLLLTAAYAHGELARIYPIARGTAPVLVTAVAVAVLGERLSPASWAGLALMIGAIGVLAFASGRPSSGAEGHGRGTGLAVATGATIACYTLLDGVGVRLSGAPPAYIAWLFAVHGPLLVAFCLWRGGLHLGARVRRHLWVGLAGGALSVVSYGIVVWAQAYAPLALVSAVRETSVIWAVLIAHLALRERPTSREITAVVLAAAGAALLQLGG